MRLLLWAALLWPLTLFSPAASAWNCTTLTPSTTAPSPGESITIPNSLPLGSVIGTQVITGEINAFSCVDSGQGTISNQTIGVRAFGESVITLNGRRMYKTNIEGVGYAIGGINTSSCNVSGWVSGSNTIRGDVNTYTLCTNPQGLIAMELKGKVMITYYKIGVVTGSGTVEGKTVGALVLLNNSLLWQSPEANVTSTPFNITTLGCTVDKAIIAVPMGEVPGNAFKGQGTTPGENYTQNFDLPLTCHAGTKVAMQIDGSVNDAANGVLNLSGTGDDNAKGVGIQVLYKDAPLPLATPLATGTASTAGSYSIPLKARYYQTENRMSGGKANGTATFTLTYD